MNVNFEKSLTKFDIITMNEENKQLDTMLQLDEAQIYEARIAPNIIKAHDNKILNHPIANAIYGLPFFFALFAIEMFRPLCLLPLLYMYIFFARVEFCIERNTLDYMYSDTKEYFKKLHVLDLERDMIVKKMSIWLTNNYSFHGFGCDKKVRTAVETIMLLFIGILVTGLILAAEQLGLNNDFHGKIGSFEWLTSVVVNIVPAILIVTVVRIMIRTFHDIREREYDTRKLYWL